LLQGDAVGQLKSAIKMLARSGSVRFVRDHFAGKPADPLASLRWQGSEVFYRPGTSDSALIYNILLKRGSKSEYCPPPQFTMAPASVRTILDIGANIGVSAVYLRKHFVNAHVHAFEPAPANVAVLERNAKSVGQMSVHGFALGDADGELELFESDNPSNYGGFSAHGMGVDSSRSTRVPVRRTDRALAELGIGSVDIIKIDTEGAEWEILSTMAPEMLRGAKLIMGELHGRRDFLLLDLLQPTFNIGLHKNVGNRLFNFFAVNRSLSG
jgi:FkbM family methyltransferase